MSNEKDVEHLLNAIFSLVITLSENEALSLVEQFCQLVSSFKGHGFQSNVKYKHFFIILYFLRRG